MDVKFRSTTASPATRHQRRFSSFTTFENDFVLYAWAAFLAVICFGNSLNGDFVHDDIPAVVQNPDVLGTTTISELFTHDFWGHPIREADSHKSYRPITTLTFRLNMMLSMHTFGFHLVNLVLHSAVSILVCRLCRQVLHFDFKMALIATSLFVTHPIHCEAVSSIVGRADVLCAFFYLLAFFAFHESIKARTCTRNQIMSLVTCFVWSSLALLSKETGITVLGVCAFYWIFVSLLPTLHRFSLSQVPKFSTPKIAALLTPIVSVVASFFVLILLRLNVNGNTMPQFSQQDNPASYAKSPLTRILTYLYLAAFNLGLLISPRHAYDWQAGSIKLIDSLADYRNLQTLALLFGLSIFTHQIIVYQFAPLYQYFSFLWFVTGTNITKLISKCQKQSKIQMSFNIDTCANNYSASHTILLAMIFLIFSYLPSSNLIITVGFVIAERLLYIPSIGYIFLLCVGMKRLDGHRSLAHVSLAVLVIVFSFRTFEQNKVWNSRRSLYKAGIINVPENAKAHYNFANLQQDNRNWDEAIRHYKTAIRLWPLHASAHNNLGALFWRISKFGEAEQHFDAALKINPYHAKAHFNLGKVYSNRGQTWEAIILMERSIQLDRRFSESYEGLATLYTQIGQWAIAERFHQRAIRLRPRNADFHNNYGTFLQKTGRIEYGLWHYHRALELRPTHRIALLNAANALTALHRYAQAEHFYKRALKLQKDPVTLDLLAMLYLRQSKLHMARHVYQYVLQRYSLLDETDERRNFNYRHHYNDYNKKQRAHHSIKRKILKMRKNKKGSINDNKLLTSDNIRIHYAQLLILEGHYRDAEVLLEALTRLERDDQYNHNNYKQLNLSLENLIESKPLLKKNSRLISGGRLRFLSRKDENKKDDGKVLLSAVKNSYNNDGCKQKSCRVHFYNIQTLSSALTKQSANQHADSDQAQNQHIKATKIAIARTTSAVGAANNQSKLKHRIIGEQQAASNSSETDDDNVVQMKLIARAVCHQHRANRSPHGILRTPTLWPLSTAAALVGVLPKQSDSKTQSNHRNRNSGGIKNGYLRGGSRQSKTDERMLLLIDVHHQLALLYTLTNRRAEALYVIAEALKMCSKSIGARSRLEEQRQSGPLSDRDVRCAQVYTLQGDIHKDLQRWTDAAESYRIAIRFDHCLERPHLNLAVIYHLESRFSEAMKHYIYARQLDSGVHHQLINENINKLKREQSMLQRRKSPNRGESNHAQHQSMDDRYAHNPHEHHYHHQRLWEHNANVDSIRKQMHDLHQSQRQQPPIRCRSRERALWHTSGMHQSPLPNTTVDQAKRETSSYVDVTSQTNSAFNLFSLHSAIQILSSH